MENINSGGAAELKEVVKSLENIDNLKKECSGIKNNLNSLTRERKNLEASLIKEGEKTLKEKEKEATASEDEEIKKLKKSISGSEADRKKAKTKGMNERIKNETEDKKKEIKEYHREIRQKFKENGMPAICDSGWFYSIFYPEKALDWIIKIVVSAIWFVGLPLLVASIVDIHIIFKVFLGVGVFAVCVTAYWILWALTKDKDTGIVEEMRTVRYKIADNKEYIRKTKRDIKKDDNEEIYNLGEFDDKLKELNSKLKEVTDTREEKYKEYKEKTEKTLTEELEKAKKEKLDAKDSEIDEMSSVYDSLCESLKKAEEEHEGNYSSVFGDKVNNKNYINKLIGLIESGAASTVEEAINAEKGGTGSEA